MEDEKILEEFEGYFDLGPKDKSEKEDDNVGEEYAHNKCPDADEDFDALTEQLSSDIEEMEKKGAVVEGDIPKEETVAEAPKEDEPVEKEEEKNEDEEDEFDRLFDEVKSEIEEEALDEFMKEEGISRPVIQAEMDKKAEEDKKTEKEFEEELETISEEISKEWLVEDARVEKQIREKATKSMTSEERIEGGTVVEWMLDSPTSMWDSFYAQKRKLIGHYMMGGQVEYERWINEMAEAQVEMRSELFDQELMVKQMEEVQQHRERMKYIAIRVNNQYFMFKRFEEMLRGFLAKVQYLKPQIKQEGLVMEHMQDVELYLSRLESLHDSVTKVERSLAGAFDVLSRKVTISMELSPVERRSRREDYRNRRDEKRSDDEEDIKVTKDVDKEVDDIFDEVAKKVVEDDLWDEFDDLPKGAIVEPGKVKTGEIKWGEI